MKTRILVSLAAAGLLVACSNKTAEKPAETGSEAKAPETASAPEAVPAPAAAPAPAAPAAADTFQMPADAELQKTPSGLKYKIEKPGTGATAAAGQTVAVHYTGWLTDGTKFDSSRPAGSPITFPLGTGQVIKGWDEGLAGMKVGEVRWLVIPPELGYGANGTGDGVIPGNATLVFRTELMGIQ